MSQGADRLSLAVPERTCRTTGDRYSAVSSHQTVITECLQFGRVSYCASSIVAGMVTQSQASTLHNGSITNSGVRWPFVRALIYRRWSVAPVEARQGRQSCSDCGVPVSPPSPATDVLPGCSRRTLSLQVGTCRCAGKECVPFWPPDFMVLPHSIMEVLSDTLFCTSRWLQGWSYLIGGGRFAIAGSRTSHFYRFVYGRVL